MRCSRQILNGIWVWPKSYLLLLLCVPDVRLSSETQEQIIGMRQSYCKGKIGCKMSKVVRKIKFPWFYCVVSTNTSMLQV